MKPMNTDKRRLARERLLSLYIGALERGDAEKLAAVLLEAEGDPVLARMIDEINDVYSAEDFAMARLVRPPANGHLSPYNGSHMKESGMQTTSASIAFSQPAKRSRISVTLAAATLAFVLFGGLLLIWMGRNAPRVQPPLLGAAQSSTATSTALVVVSATPTTPDMKATLNAQATHIISLATQAAAADLIIIQATLNAQATQIADIMTQTAAANQPPQNAVATANAVITLLPPTIEPPAALPFVKMISITVSQNMEPQEIQALAVGIIAWMGKSAGFSEVWLSRPGTALTHVIAVDNKGATAIPGTVPPGFLSEIEAWIGQSDTLPLQIQMSNVGGMPLYIEISANTLPQGGSGVSGEVPTALPPVGGAVSSETPALLPLPATPTPSR
jgi:hypothetical protein